MRTKLAAATVASALVIGGASASANHEGSPPDAVLRTGETRQQGDLWGYCWSYGDSTMCVDGWVWGWPNARPAISGAQAQIRFDSRHRPNKVLIRRWHRVGPETSPGQRPPKGDGKLIRKTLHPVVRDGKRVAWRAVFTLPRRPGHIYIAVSAHYDQGDPFYGFHLKLR